MGKLSKGELLKTFEEMWDAATIGDTWKLNEHAVQAFNQIKELIQNQPEVSEKDVYDFHDGYATLDYEDISDNSEMDTQERRYIKNWLKSIGVKIKED